MEVRINKYLSQCGIGSRRKNETRLTSGQFKVNGKTAEPGQMIDPKTDVVQFRNKIISPTDTLFYLALNKPKGVLSTVSDEKGRQTVMDFIDIKERLYPVGRLDKESTGLILLTNDGDLALKLTHPRYHLPKVYAVTTQENVTNMQLRLLEEGVEIEGKMTQPARVKKTDNKAFTITIHEGMNRQIRKMCNEVNLTVKSLNRISIGPVKIGNLKKGEVRELTEEEIEYLK